MNSYGGFGGAPKFPRPSVFNFLLRFATRASGNQADRAATMAAGTLRHMASGGMRDHLGGGFHRYSVDEFWHVPHFEKMLYDQAQLAISLVEVWQLTHDDSFATIARETLDYVLRDMTHPEGGFFSAEDADSLIVRGRPEHAEGAYYVWTRQEIADALDPRKHASSVATTGSKRRAMPRLGVIRRASSAAKMFLSKGRTPRRPRRFSGFPRRKSLDHSRPPAGNFLTVARSDHARILTTRFLPPGTD